MAPSFAGEVDDATDALEDKPREQTEADLAFDQGWAARVASLWPYAMREGRTGTTNGDQDTETVPPTQESAAKVRVVPGNDFLSGARKSICHANGAAREVSHAGCRRAIRHSRTPCRSTPQ